MNAAECNAVLRYTAMALLSGGMKVDIHIRDDGDFYQPMRFWFHQNLPAIPHQDIGEVIRRLHTSMTERGGHRSLHVSPQADGSVQITRHEVKYADYCESASPSSSAEALWKNVREQMYTMLSWTLRYGFVRTTCRMAEDPAHRCVEMEPSRYNDKGIPQEFIRKVLTLLSPYLHLPEPAPPKKVTQDTMLTVYSRGGSLVRMAYCKGGYYDGVTIRLGNRDGRQEDFKVKLLKDGWHAPYQVGPVSCSDYGNLFSPVEMFGPSRRKPGQHPAQAALKFDDT